jgi:hypothetical protein
LKTRTPPHTWSPEALAPRDQETLSRPAVKDSGLMAQEVYYDAPELGHLIYRGSPELDEEGNNIPLKAPHPEPQRPQRPEARGPKTRKLSRSIISGLFALCCLVSFFSLCRCSGRRLHAQLCTQNSGRASSPSTGGKTCEAVGSLLFFRDPAAYRVKSARRSLGIPRRGSLRRRHTRTATTSEQPPMAA